MGPHRWESSCSFIFRFFHFSLRGGEAVAIFRSQNKLIVLSTRSMRLARAGWGGVEFPSQQNSRDVVGAVVVGLALFD
jgi:hypothetical protein